MGYRAKRAVLAGIARRERERGGKRCVRFDAYLGYDPFTGKQIRLSAGSEKDLRKKVDLFYARRAAGGDVAVTLSAADAADAAEALSVLRAACPGARLSDAAREFAGRRGAEAAAPRVTVGEAYDAYLAGIPEIQGVQRATVASRVGKWAAETGRDRPLAGVTAAGLEEWLGRRRGASAKTYNNNLSYIRTFLNWCGGAGRGWLRENPAAGIARRAVPWKEPAYMAAADAAAMFAALRASGDGPALAYAVMSYFCGARRAEILRLASVPGAGRVDLEDETVRIALPKGWTKGVAPRAFQIEANALAWMRSFGFAEALAGVGAAAAARAARIARAAGAEPPRNGGRHTFITMHVAAYRDPAATAAAAGTSLAMLARSYRGLASRREGLAFFAIMP